MLGWLSTLVAKYSSSRGLDGAAEQDGTPGWLADLPTSVLFLDVQTTGLSAADRVVTFGAVKLTTAPLQHGLFELEFAHLIFNPRRTIFSRAEQVQGYSDWILRHQDRFSAHAERIEDLIGSCDLLVAHNAEFGLKFINRELALDGRDPISRPIFCTMKGYRRLRKRGGCSLDEICEQLDLPCPSQGALENAWLAMLTYLWLHKCPYRSDFPSGLQASPSNLRAPPRLPANLIPRDRTRKPATQPTPEPVQLPGHVVPIRAAEAPVTKPAAEPIRIAATLVPETTPITAVPEVPIQLAELAPDHPADTPITEFAEQLIQLSVESPPIQADAPPSAESTEAPVRLPTRTEVAAPMIEAGEPTPLPANNLRPCVDDAPSMTMAEEPIQLPEVSMPEQARNAPTTAPQDDLPRLPAKLMLPTLGFDAPEAGGAKV